MFFDSPDEIMPISTRNGASIFVVPDSLAFSVSNSLVIQPEKRASITIEQIRDVINGFTTKQFTDQYIIIRPADLMNLEAANALLKSLEEPKEKIHFLLVTSQPSKLPPTILSRAAIYFLRTKLQFREISSNDAKIKSFAKRLIVAKDRELPQLVEEITKAKKNVRTYTLEILKVTIEMLYKSYFITNRKAFIEKLPKFLAAYDAINQNGHIKLHLVADLC